MPPLVWLLEGTWDSRFATLFALRESVHRFREQIYPQLRGGDAGTRLAHPSSVFRPIVRSSDSKISAIVAPDRISISQDS